MPKKTQLQLLSKILLALSGTLGCYALYLVFIVAPNERYMGAVQRIFYFHVGSALACYTTCALLLIASLSYLVKRSQLADGINEAAGEVGLVFSSIVLASGMIWGHSAWNTWFRWEPRLVSFLVLWFIFLSFTLLRAFGDRARLPQHCAILGILGACMVPVVVYSIKFLPGVPQLHPVVIGQQGLRDARFYEAFIITSLALIIFALFLVALRTRIAIITRSLRHGNNT